MRVYRIPTKLRASLSGMVVMVFLTVLVVFAHFRTFRELREHRLPIAERNEIHRSLERHSQNWVDRLIQRGRNLQRDRVENLEKNAAGSSLSLSDRIQLIGYYGQRGLTDERALSAHVHHVLWLVEHEPESAVLMHPAARLDPELSPEAYEKVKHLWLERLDKAPENLAFKVTAVEMLKGRD